MQLVTFRGDPVAFYAQNEFIILNLIFQKHRAYSINSRRVNMRISEGKTGQSLSKICSILAEIVSVMPKLLHMDQWPVLCRYYID